LDKWEDTAMTYLFCMVTDSGVLKLGGAFLMD